MDTFANLLAHAPDIKGLALGAAAIGAGMLIRAGNKGLCPDRKHNPLDYPSYRAERFARVGRGLLRASGLIVTGLAAYGAYKAGTHLSTGEAIVADSAIAGGGMAYFNLALYRSKAGVRALRRAASRIDTRRQVKSVKPLNNY